MTDSIWINCRVAKIYLILGEVNIYKVCSLHHVILLSQSFRSDIGTDEDPGIRIESFAKNYVVQTTNFIYKNIFVIGCYAAYLLIKPTVCAYSWVAMKQHWTIAITFAKWLWVRSFWFMYIVWVLTECGIKSKIKIFKILGCVSFSTETKWLAARNLNA